MADARLVIANNGKLDFTWTQVEENKWEERLCANGNDGWFHVHKVEFLSTDHVEKFADSLEQCGFFVTVIL